MSHLPGYTWRAMTGLGLLGLFGSVVVIYGDNWDRMPLWLVIATLLIAWVGLVGQFLTGRRR